MLQMPKTTPTQTLLGALYKLHLGITNADEYTESERYLLRDIWLDKARHREVSGKYEIWRPYEATQSLIHLRDVLFLQKRGFDYYRNAIKKGTFNG